MEFAQRLIRGPGKRTLRLFATLGGLFLLVWRVLSRLLRFKLDWGEFWRAAYGFGEKLMLAGRWSSFIADQFVCRDGIVSHCTIKMKAYGHI